MQKAREPVLSRAVVFAVGAIVIGASAALAGFGQTTTPASAPAAQPAAAAGAPRPSFEVASIRLNHSGARNGGIRWGGDMFTSANMSLKNLIEIAYQLKDFQLIGGPSWIGSDRYDIDAKLGEEAQKLPPDQRLKQTRLMLQSLLADRFKLVLRQETKTLPVYRLVAAKSGPKLNVATGRSGWSEGNGQIKAQAVTTATLAEILSNQLEREVVDETNLPGRYDISLRWSPDNGAAPPEMPRAAAQAGALQPGAAAGSVFTAIQEQLGLKLEAAKAPVETLVVVHIERPSEN